MSEAKHTPGPSCVSGAAGATRRRVEEAGLLTPLPGVSVEAVKAP